MNKRFIKIIETICILILIYIGLKIFPYFENILKVIFHLLLPFLIGFGIAFLFEPLLEWLEKKKIKRKISIYLIIIFFSLLIYLIIKYAIPSFFYQINKLIDMIPSYLGNLENIIAKFSKKFERTPINFQIDYDKIGVFITNKLEEILAKSGTILQRSFSSLLDILITPIIAIYFMLDYDKIEKLIKDYLTNHNKKDLYIALIDIKRIVRQYFKGVVIVMGILSIVSSICFMIIGIEYSIIFGLIIGITDIIPYIGPYIGGGIVGIFTLVANPSKILIVILIIVILQIIEGNYLLPKIQSKTSNIHPIIALIAVAVFGEIFGVLGMIFAIPLAKIIEILTKTFYCHKKM